MSTLIVAFPKLEEAKAVRNLLIHRGFDVAVPCTSGAQAINQADTLSDGIIICGYKLDKRKEGVEAHLLQHLQR